MYIYIYIYTPAVHNFLRREAVGKEAALADAPEAGGTSASV